MYLNLCFFENRETDFSGIGERSLGRQNWVGRSGCSLGFFGSFSDLFLHSLYKLKFIKSVLSSSTFIVLMKAAEENSMLFCTNRE